MPASDLSERITRELTHFVLSSVAPAKSSAQTCFQPGWAQNEADEEQGAVQTSAITATTPTELDGFC